MTTPTAGRRPPLRDLLLALGLVLSIAVGILRVGRARRGRR